MTADLFLHPRQDHRLRPYKRGSEIIADHSGDIDDALIIQRTDTGYRVGRVLPDGIRWFDVRSTPSVIEMINDTTQLSAATGRPTRILFENLSDGEVTGLVRSAELRALQPAAGGTGGLPPPPGRATTAAAPGDAGGNWRVLRLRKRSDGGSSRLLVDDVRRLRQRYQWNSATIEAIPNSEVSLASSGQFAGQYQYSYRVTVDASVPNQAGMLLSLRAYFRDRGRDISDVLNTIRSTFRRPRT